MRLQRQLVDLQTRLRLSTTGSKDDVRQSYVPGLLSVLVDPILQAGQAGIPGVIDAMDEYYLLPEDRETLVELELGDVRREDRLKKVPAAVKSAFTRAYNARSQYVSCTDSSPMAFLKTAAPATKGRAIKTEMPDNEEAYGVRDLCRSNTRRMRSLPTTQTRRQMPRPTWILPRYAEAVAHHRMRSCDRPNGQRALLDLERPSNGRSCALEAIGCALPRPSEQHVRLVNSGLWPASPTRSTWLMVFLLAAPRPAWLSVEPIHRGRRHSLSDVLCATVPSSLGCIFFTRLGSSLWLSPLGAAISVL